MNASESARRQAARTVFGRSVIGPPGTDADEPAGPTPRETAADGPPAGSDGPTVERAPAAEQGPTDRDRRGETVPNLAARRAPRPVSPSRRPPPGAAVRHRRVLTVYLPKSPREALYADAEQSRQTLGRLAMAALRDNYAQLRDEMGAPPPGADLFPDERPRQRAGLEAPRQVSLSLSPAQAASVGSVLDEFGCTASELFTAALTHQYLTDPR
ncbi:MAG: hypothetical protein OEY23_00725 [Acidimicrobiia bacterium]|nr:hypothetical protein [Acidimicrobiia bacterium]